MNEKIIWFLRGFLVCLLVLGTVWSTIAIRGRIESDRRLADYRATVEGLKEANSRLSIAYRQLEVTNCDLKKQFETRERIITDIATTLDRLGSATGGIEQTIDRIIEAVQRLRTILESGAR